MGRRKCSVDGCQSTAGLHGFPVDFGFRRQWLRAIGLDENTELPVRAGVCDRHFTRDSYSNFFEVENGFTTQLRLKSEAVPTLALHQQPRPPAPTLQPRIHYHGGTVLRHLEPKGTREIGCQTDKVLTMHEFVQANVLPSRRSKAIQARAPHRSAYSDTNDLMENPESEIRRPPSLRLKRKSALTEVSLHNDKEHIVDEDQLLVLFRRCPLCTGLCTVDTVTTGTVLQVTQKCPRCDFCFQWSSQPTVDSITSGNQRLCAFAPDDSLLGRIPKDEQIEVPLSDLEAQHQSDEDSDVSMEESGPVKRKRSEDYDEDWLPERSTEELNEPEQNSSSEEDIDREPKLSDNEKPSSGDLFLNLCSECGLFYWPHIPHTCIHKEKPHACKLCGRRYATEESLKRHHSRTHNLKKKWTRRENWTKPL